MNNQNTPSFARRTVWPAVTGLTAVLAVASALIGLHGVNAQASNPPAALVPAGTPVSVAAVTPSEVTAWQEFSGRLEAVQRVDVRSRVAGAVQAVHFREGMLVKQGDLLVTIDPDPYAAEVDRAQAQVAAAQARVSHAGNEYERAQRLWKEQAIAQRELDDRANERNESQANLRAAQASLQVARLSLGYTQVRAPISGRIGRLEVTAGNLVAAGPGAPVLANMVSVDPIYASFEVDENVVVRALKDLPGGASARQLIERIPVRMGTSATDNTPFEGHLQLIDNQVDVGSGTVRVRASFDNKDGALMPGQFARVRMGQAHAVPALLVNERAVGTDQNKKFVMVVGEGNKAEYRAVTLGALSNGLRVVTAGLQAGDRVVVNGLQHIRPGSLLAPQDVPMESKNEAQAAGNEAPRS